MILLRGNIVAVKLKQMQKIQFKEFHFLFNRNTFLKVCIFSVFLFILLACQPSERAVNSPADLDNLPAPSSDGENTDFRDTDVSEDDEAEGDTDPDFPWCDPEWVSNPMPVEDFLSQQTCREHPDCPEGYYCLRKESENEGLCAKKCIPGEDCPENLCGLGCPPGQICGCCPGTVCGWDWDDVFPICKTECKVADPPCQGDKLCIHDIIDARGRVPKGRCINSFPNRSSGCPKGYFSSGRIHPHHCFPGDDGTCEEECYDGYGCQNGGCHIMCPEQLGRLCTWRSAPFVIFMECGGYPHCHNEYTSESSICCGNDRCCQAVGPNEHVAFCRSEKDCESGIFLDPY